MLTYVMTDALKTLPLLEEEDAPRRMLTYADMLTYARRMLTDALKTLPLLEVEDAYADVC
jgi:hypothetical protein